MSRPEIRKAVVFDCIAALALARAERRFEGTVKDIRARESAEANPIVMKMKQYAHQSKWVYSQSGIYPFHAGLKVIPDLAIVMPKRFWSGQITTTGIIEECKRNGVDMIILPKEALNQEWIAFLQVNYQLADRDRASFIYVSLR